MKRIRMMAKRVAEVYAGVTERHGLLITIIVCVVVVFGSGLWVKLTPAVNDDKSEYVSDTPDIVDRLADVISLATFPPIATPSPTPPPRYTKPASGEVIREFSSGPVYMRTTDSYGVHMAVDIITTKGENVLSPFNGKVSEIKRNAKYGWVMVIDLSDGSRVSIAGLSSPLVKERDSVKQGQAIGVSGGSIPRESLDEPHIHIEYIVDGAQSDITMKWD